MIDAIDKLRDNKIFRIMISVVLVLSLSMSSAVLGGISKAYAAGETITVTVDELMSTLPALTEGVDFTYGEPVGSDPVNYEAPDGTTPLADLVAQKEAQGYTLHWYTSLGTEFSWTETPVTSSLSIVGHWEPTVCDITLSYGDDGATADVTTQVPWGQSYASVAGTPSIPTKLGFTCTGWVDSETGEAFDFNAPVTTSQTLTPNWVVADVEVAPITDVTTDVPETVTGRCYIGDTWSVHPAHFSVSKFTGYLAGASMEGLCYDRSAAQPSYVWADYTATLKDINYETGEITYDVMVTPPGVTNGVDRNQFGLIGYQRVHGKIVIKKNLGGWIEIQKSSSNTDMTDGNDCYSLENAEFTIFNSDEEAVDRITTDADGYAKSKILPAGKYTVVETKAPQGYALAETPWTVTVNGGATDTLEVSDVPQNDPANILVSKYDGEKIYQGEDNLPQGSASLAGAEYVVTYYDTTEAKTAEDLGYVNAANAGDYTRQWVFSTDANGFISLQLDDPIESTSDGLITSDSLYKSSSGLTTLPLGTYVIQEYTAPEGYLLSDEIVIQSVTSVGTFETVNTWNEPDEDTALQELVKRGDVEFQKRNDQGEAMAGIPFRITSQTTGESHIVVTDENGSVNTASNWRAHTYKTNYNDEPLFGVYDSEAGIWFGTTEYGETIEADDSRGALPYDTYTLEELRCDANEGMNLITTQFTINRDNADLSHAVDLGTLDNHAASIGTSATDGTDSDKELVADTEATIVDTVTYSNLVPGKEYTVSGTLMVKSTGEPLLDAEGNPVTASTTFTPTSEFGTVNVTFTFDASALAGESVVVFEDLYQNEELVCSHENINDQNQTVEVIGPEIGTTATDGIDGDKIVVSDPEAVINDSVLITNVVPGKEYTISGVLMDKATGEPLLVNGEQVTAEKTITPTLPFILETLTFEFDASALTEDTQLVVYETLLRGETEIASHEDINDEGQTVTIDNPEIGTEANDGLDGDKNVIANDTATIVDTVSYENLIPGKEYTVSGTLMVKSTGEPLLDAEGNPVTGSTTFTPDLSHGTVEVTFTFDSSLLAGEDLVAFEKLLRNDIEVEAHEDIDDESQTVTVIPSSVGTTAWDTADGDKNVVADVESSVTDTVEYSDFVPGEEYTLVGILMDKETGLPLLSGEGVEDVDTEALKTFTEELYAALGAVIHTEVTIDEFDYTGEVQIFNGVTLNNENGVYTLSGTGEMTELTEGSVIGIVNEGSDPVVLKINTIENSESNTPSEGESTWSIDFTADALDAETASQVIERITVAQIDLPATPDYEALTALMEENADLVNMMSIEKATFTPESTSGTYDVEFPLNSLNIAGKDTVVFEFALNDSQIVAYHTDLEDEGQTVSLVPSEIGTEATDKSDGDHNLIAGRDATIVDTVTYTNLIPGKEYTISGVLMDKATGEPLIVGDSQVTAETSFTPNQSDGTIELEFSFDASGLEGTTVVVFEHLYKDGIEVATHADINDEAQSVTLVAPPEGESAPGSLFDQTGGNTLPIIILISVIALAGAGAGAYAYRQRKLAQASATEESDSSVDEE